MRMHVPDVVKIRYDEDNIEILRNSILANLCI